MNFLKLKLIFLLSLSFLISSCYADNSKNSSLCDNVCLFELAKSKYLENHREINEKIVSIYQQSADEGNYSAKKTLAYIYGDKGGKFYNFSRAENYLIDMVNKKDYEQACYLGNLIINEFQNELDNIRTTEVKKLFLLASKHKQKCGYHDLAVFYSNRKEYIEAFKYFSQSAQVDGYANSELALGTYYQYGNPPVKKDYRKAKYWYEKAAEQKNSEAINLLAYMYIEGLGVNKNNKEAISLLITASNLGNGKAAFNLGQIYETGKLGEKKDVELSKKWFLKAKELGYSD